MRLKLRLKPLLWLAGLGGMVSLSPAARADVIPYAAVGTPNPVTYSFVAASTGDITAYFAGSTADYDDALGLLINGVLSGVGFGLGNHASAIGQSLDFGRANAGDTLVFVLNVISPSLGNAYSQPSMNTAFDGNGALGHNHIYATPYTATSPLLPGVPAGTYVAFEDLPFPASDFNYHDATYVVTNVAPTLIPEPTSLAPLAAALLCFGLFRAKHRLR